jgi:chromosomal replication initiation ATPase DnaA
MLTPRQIKAKRILLGLKVRDLADEASKVLNREIGESTIAHILSRRMQGSKPEVHELQKFVAKRLKIPVKDLKPPFETMP